MSTSYRVLLAGGDHTHQEQYARHFMEDGRCLPVAVTDAPGVDTRRHQLNAALAQRFGVPYLPFDEAMELQFEIASVCVAMERRADVAEKLAAKGVHLYLDKPLAPSLRDARSIASAVRRNGVIAQIFSQATSSWGAGLRSWVQQNASSSAASLHARMLVAKGMPGGFDNALRVERSQIGPIPDEPAKRELFDLGFYPVSLLTWASGDLISHVTAHTANYFLNESRAADVEDLGVLVFEFQGGLIATASCGRIGTDSHPGRGYIEVLAMGNGPVERFSPDQDSMAVHAKRTELPADALGDDPLAMWDGTLRRIRNATDFLRPVQADPVASDVSAFIDCIEKGTQPEIGVADGAHHVAVIEAAYRSAVSGLREKV